MKNNTIFVPLYLIMMFSLIVMSGCGQQSVTTSAVVTASTEQTEYIYRLASRYLFSAEGHDASKRMLDEIQALHGDEARIFHKALSELDKQQPANDQEKNMEAAYNALTKYADTKGVTVMSLHQNEIESFLKEWAISQSATSTHEKLNSNSPTKHSPKNDLLPCVPGWVSCDTADFGDTARGGSCGSNCTTASGSDRVSNATCELLACDHRIWFPTTRNSVASRDAIGTCIIDYYDGGLASRYDGRRELIVGVGGPIKCKIYTGVDNYLKLTLMLF